MDDKQVTKGKVYSGVVVSDKMDKTVVVNTFRNYKHPQYHKILRKSKKYAFECPRPVHMLRHHRPGTPNRSHYHSRIQRVSGGDPKKKCSSR